MSKVKIVLGITIHNDQQVRRNKDGEVLTLITPDPKIGYYNSMMKLKSQGFDITKYADKQTVELNPTRFTKIK